jgi:hypothetical protein
VITQNVTLFALVLKSLLTLNHPEANLLSIATFLWCIWKARNDDLFCMKKCKPQQIAVQAKALCNNLEVPQKAPQQHHQEPVPPSDRVGAARSEDSMNSDFYFAGPKLYLDAAWKLEPNQVTATAGLGIYFTCKEQHGHTDVIILAAKHNVPSPIQAEAHALSLAGRLAAALRLQEPIFFLDCANLVKGCGNARCCEPGYALGDSATSHRFPGDDKVSTASYFPHQEGDQRGSTKLRTSGEAIHVIRAYSFLQELDS